MLEPRSLTKDESFCPRCGSINSSLSLFCNCGQPANDKVKNLLDDLNKEDLQFIDAPIFKKRKFELSLSQFGLFLFFITLIAGFILSFQK